MYLLPHLASQFLLYAFSTADHIRTDPRPGENHHITLYAEVFIVFLLC